MLTETRSSSLLRFHRADDRGVVLINPLFIVWAEPSFKQRDVEYVENGMHLRLSNGDTVAVSETLEDLMGIH